MNKFINYMKEDLEQLVKQLKLIFKKREEHQNMSKKINYLKKNQTNKITNKKTPAEKPDLTEQQKQEIRDSLTQQLVAREYAPVSHDTLSKSITYVTAGNGLFKVRKTPIAIFKEQIAEFKNENLGLPDMQEGVELGIQKLPFRYLIEALSFYRDVNELDKTEASILYFYNHQDVKLPDVPGIREENKIITYVPVQENSKTLSDFKDDDNVHWLRENTALLLESHSHNSMDAFFSGTDDANENNNQFYTVWGKVEQKEPMIAFRYVVGDTKVDISPTVLFEWPILEEVTKTQKIIETLIHGETDLVDINSNREVEVNEPEVSKEFVYIKGPFKHFDYPDEWLDQHSKSIPTYNYSYQKRAAAKRSSYNAYNPYGYDEYYNEGGAKQLTFDYQEDVFSSEQTFGADELDNLSIYIGFNEYDVPSPALEDSIFILLDEIRNSYPGVYKQFKN